MFVKKPLDNPGRKFVFNYLPCAQIKDRDIVAKNIFFGTVKDQTSNSLVFIALEIIFLDFCYSVAFCILQEPFMDNRYNKQQ